MSTFDPLPPAEDLQNALERLPQLLHDVRAAACQSRLTYPERDYIRELCNLTEALASKPLPPSDDVERAAYLWARRAHADEAHARGRDGMATRYLDGLQDHMPSIKRAVTAFKAGAALSAQSPPPAPEPVETAPKDGSYFLFVGTNFDGGMAVVQWDKDLEWWTLDDGKNPEIALRHESGLIGWLPLPQFLSPKADGGDHG